MNITDKININSISYNFNQNTNLKRLIELLPVEKILNSWSDALLKCSEVLGKSEFNSPEWRLTIRSLK